MNKTTYIPDKLILFRRKNWDGSFCRWEIYCLSPSQKSIIPNLETENLGYYNPEMKEIYRKYKDDILQGIIPEELKDRVKIIPNTPFRPTIVNFDIDSEDNISPESVYNFKFKNPVENISLQDIDAEMTSMAVMRLGVDRGNVLRDGVLAFTYESRRYSSGLCTSDPSQLCLMEATGPFYEDVKKRSEWMRKECPVKGESFEPGRIYQMKGDMCPKDKSKLSQLAIYLGKLKFANGTICNGNIPGKKFTRIDAWMDLDMWRNNPFKSKGAPLTIFTAGPEHVLCKSYDHPSPIPKDELKDIITRFERSMWSAEFWKTPGIVHSFSPMLTYDIEFLKEVEAIIPNSYHLNMYTTHQSFFPREMYLKPGSKTLKTVVRKEISPTNWYRSLTYSSVEENYASVSLDASDPTLPLQIYGFLPGGVIKNLGGKVWIEDDPDKGEFLDILKSLREKNPSIPEKERGIKYTTSDGYIFYQVYEVLLSHRAALWKTPELYNDLRQWTICGKIE